MRALLLSLILILATAINCYASNSVYIKQTDQTGSSVFIKQDGSSNVVGINTTNPILIQGNNVDVIIKQIGNSNDVGADFDGNQPGFMGTNMTFDYQVTGNSNDLELDQSDINSTGHWYDIDITGSSNKLIFRSDASKDVDNTNVDLDVRGSSNYMKFYVMEDNHFLYVLVDGDSNTVKFKALDGATGFNTNANKAIGPNVESHGILADSSPNSVLSIPLSFFHNSISSSSCIIKPFWYFTMLPSTEMSFLFSIVLSICFYRIISMKICISYCLYKFCLTWSFKFTMI